MVKQLFPACELPAYVAGEMKVINLEEYYNKTMVLVFYPYNFTFVCPTEITGLSRRQAEFAQENAEVLLVSCDSVYSHKAWCEDKDGGIYGSKLPMLSDMGGKLSKRLGIYVKKEGRPCRATFIVQNGVVVYQAVHDDVIGRSSTEILRVLKALNFQKKHGGVCPLDWSES